MAVVLGHIGAFLKEIIGIILDNDDIWSTEDNLWTVSGSHTVFNADIINFSLSFGHHCLRRR